MPNSHQLTFLGSLVGSFALLAVVTKYLNSKLLDAGYDISELILLGIPKDQLYYHESETSAENMSVTTESFPLNAWQLVKDNLSPQTAAFVVAILTTAYIWTKVIHTGSKYQISSLTWLFF
jgi:cytochrome-b5 reductase